MGRLRSMKTFLLIALAGCSPETTQPDASVEAGTRAIGVDHVDDLGVFPAPPTVVGRDGTTSALLGNQLVWTFGDTFLSKATLDDKTSVRSATAGWSQPDAALAITDAVDDAGIPIQFIPYTSAELAKNTADPLNGFALWPGAVIPTSASNAVVLFQHVLRQGGSGFTADAIGTASITSGAAQAVRDAAFLFQSPDPLFGNGGVTIDSGGNAYFFDCEQAGFGFHCKVGRVPVASVTNRSAFEFWNGTAYASDVTQAAWFIDGAGAGLTITWNAWLGRWLAVYNKVLSDDVALRAADHIEGPWTDPEVVIPGSNFVEGDAGTNYLAREHAELQAQAGRELVISYAHPLPNFGGACRLARVTLK
jgi:hypothetical protein